MGKVKRTWLTHRNKTRQYLYPKQALYTSWIVCIRVSPVWPLQQAVSVKHGAGPKHGPDTAERASPCVFTEIKITLEDTASPRQRWQTYELPTDVQAAVATVTNRCSGRKQEMFCTSAAQWESVIWPISLLAGYVCSGSIIYYLALMKMFTHTADILITGSVVWFCTKLNTTWQN